LFKYTQSSERISQGNNVLHLHYKSSFFCVKWNLILIRTRATHRRGIGISFHRGWKPVSWAVTPLLYYAIVVGGDNFGKVLKIRGYALVNMNR